MPSRQVRCGSRCATKPRAASKIRDEHDKKLYRLFCVIDRKAIENGLAHAVVCYLDGATKAVGSALPQATYLRLAGFRRDYLATNPRRVLERLP